MSVARDGSPAPARRRRGVVALLAATLLLALAGCASEPQGAARVSTPDDGSGYHGAALDEPYAMPAGTFTDTTGRAFTLPRDARKPVTLLFFGYTNCPDLCNVVLANVASALRRSPDHVQDRVQLLFVTTDPQRDTPAAMLRYLGRFDPGFVGLTAPAATVRAAAATVHVAVEGIEPNAHGGYDVPHGTQLIGFGADRRAHVVWPDDIAVDGLRDDLARLAGGVS